MEARGGREAPQKRSRRLGSRSAAEVFKRCTEVLVNFSAVAAAYGDAVLAVATATPVMKATIAAEESRVKELGIAMEETLTAKQEAEDLTDSAEAAEAAVGAADAILEAMNDQDFADQEEDEDEDEDDDEA